MMNDGSRIIPTHYDNGDFWRNNPLWERRPLWERSMPRWETPRWEPMQPLSMQPLSSTPPFPTTLAPPPPPPDFYPVREHRMNNFETEMRRMNDEMNKMMSNMSRMTPMSSNVDDLRLTENFKMDNPIQSYPDGTRKFHLEFDMRQFKPEEIQVRTAGNNLSVYAKHEEKDSGKSVFREYNRSYLLPKDVQPDRLASKLSTGGILTIEAPLPAIEGPREKLIPIKHN